jgi:hypothetical protein
MEKLNVVNHERYKNKKVKSSLCLLNLNRKQHSFGRQHYGLIRKQRTLSVIPVRVASILKWTDNHGLYGLCLHSVGSCSIYGKPPYRTSRRSSKDKGIRTKRIAASFSEYEKATRKYFVLENLILERIGYYPAKLAESYM